MKDKWISELAGVFCDPIVVYPGGWEDTIPDWLKHAIKIERLLETARAAKDGDIMATDAEACAYLYTMCLCVPPDHDWTEIYQYLVTKVYRQFRSKDSGVEVPEDIRKDSLSRQQMDDLNHLKREIYHTRSQHRLEKERAERREVRKEEKERRQLEQPALPLEEV